MILFNKKKIIFITLSIILSILYVSIDKNTKTQEVSSTPVSNHTIILDAGHGFPDGGATSFDGNTIESNLNLILVQKLQSLLESSNCNVILTRSDKNGIYGTDSNSIRDKKISDMKNRSEIANNSNAEMFVSIHMNKINENKYNGFQTFYKSNDKNSKLIAENIQTSLSYYLKPEKPRTIKSISGIYLTKKVNIPLVIIECGFLSNEEETKKLNNDTYQNELAWSIYIGIMEYLNKST